MIVVHHLNNSRSQRVLWLLEELGLDYEMKRYQRDAKTMLAPPELRHVHPLGKSPVITDGELTLAESGAIVEYLVERYGEGRVRARAGHARAPALHLLAALCGGLAHAAAAAEAGLQPDRDRADAVLRAADGARHRAPGEGTFIEPQIERHLDYLEAELAQAAWFAGDDFTAADIQMSFPLEAAAARGGLDATRPRLMGFLERIHARPAYRRALEAGGPYALAR